MQVYRAITQAADHHLGHVLRLIGIVVMLASRLNGIRQKRRNRVAGYSAFPEDMMKTLGMIHHCNPPLSQRFRPEDSRSC